VKNTNDEDGHGAYVWRVARDNQRYTETLMAENHRLRLRVAALENLQQRAEESAAMVEQVLQQNEALRAQVAVLQQESVRIQEKMLEAYAALERARRGEQELEASVRRVQADGERFAEQYRDLEWRNTNLANLYVASYRLHGTLKRGEVLSTILEIVTNLIGSEQIAVFERHPGGEALTLVTSAGIDPRRYRLLPLDAGVIGACVRSGQTFVAGDGPEPALRTPEEAELSACVPLRLDGRVSGAIALFRLLPQKSGIESLDRELFDLLATHAATALHCASLHGRNAEPES
jgi:hypothetical protein